MDRIILLSLCFIAVSSAGCTFKRYPYSALYGYSIKEVKSVEAWECKQKCLMETTFACLSFDYDTDSKTCHLSPESKISQPGSFSTHASVDHYEMLCGDDVGEFCGAGLLHFKTSCYGFIIGSDKNWEDAQEFCARDWGHLAIINDEEEFDFIKSGILHALEHINEDGLFWIAGLMMDDKWLWDMGNGEFWPIGFLRWYPGEPNNFKSQGEDAMNIKYKDNKWGYNDEKSTRRLRFICEYEI